MVLWWRHGERGPLVPEGRNYPIRVNVTFGLRAKLRAEAAKNETSVASIIRKAVEEHLERVDNSAEREAD